VWQNLRSIIPKADYSYRTRRTAWSSFTLIFGGSSLSHTSGTRSMQRGRTGMLFNTFIVAAAQNDGYYGFQAHCVCRKFRRNRRHAIPRKLNGLDV
jgi:hypothetical protein